MYYRQFCTGSARLLAQERQVDVLVGGEGGGLVTQVGLAPDDDPPRLGLRHHQRVLSRGGVNDHDVVVGAVRRSPLERSVHELARLAAQRYVGPDRQVKRAHGYAATAAGLKLVRAISTTWVSSTGTGSPRFSR